MEVTIEWNPTGEQHIFDVTLEATVLDVKVLLCKSLGLQADRIQVQLRDRLQDTGNTPSFCTDTEALCDLDVSSGSTLLAIPLHPWKCPMQHDSGVRITSLSLSPDATLFVATEDDVQTFEMTSGLRGWSSNAVHLTVTATQHFVVAVTATDTPKISILYVENGTHYRTVEGGGVTTALSSCGEVVLQGTRCGVVRGIDCEKGCVLASIECGEWPRSIRVAHDTAEVACVLSNSTVEVFRYDSSSSEHSFAPLTTHAGTAFTFTSPGQAALASVAQVTLKELCGDAAKRLPLPGEGASGVCFTELCYEEDCGDGDGGLLCALTNTCEVLLWRECWGQWRALCSDEAAAVLPLCGGVVVHGGGDGIVAAEYAKDASVWNV